MLTLIAVCLLPVILREVLDPPVINLTARCDRMSFEFASSETVIDLVMQNTHAEWIRLNGQDMSFPERLVLRQKQDEGFSAGMTKPQINS